MQVPPSHTPLYSVLPAMRCPVRGQAFSLIELLIALATIAILAAIMLPLFGHLRETSAQAQCVSNLRQIGSAIMIYTSENNGELPWGYMNARGAWSDQGTLPNVPPLVQILIPEGFTKEDRMRKMTVLKCPAVADVPDSMSSYAANMYVMGFIDGSTTYPLKKLSDFADPARTVVIGEKNVEAGKEANKWFEDKYRNWNPQSVLVERHGGGSNFLYLDGHVAAKRIAELTQREIKGQ